MIKSKARSVTREYCRWCNADINTCGDCKTHLDTGETIYCKDGCHYCERCGKLRKDDAVHAEDEK